MGDSGKPYCKKFPGPPRTDFLKLSEGLPSCHPVWAGFINVEWVRILLDPQLLSVDRNSRILKRDIDQVNTLIKWDKIVAHPCHHSAVQPTREQHSHFRCCLLLISSWWQGNIQNPQFERLRQLQPEGLHRWRVGG